MKNYEQYDKMNKEETTKKQTTFPKINVDYSKELGSTISEDTKTSQASNNNSGYTNKNTETDSIFNLADGKNQNILANPENLLKRNKVESAVNKVYEPMFAKSKTRKVDMPKGDALKTKTFLNTLGYTGSKGNTLKEDDVWDDDAKIALEKYVGSGVPKQEVFELQKTLNENGIPDKDGNPLKEDGKYGTKTDSAVYNARNMFGSITQKDTKPVKDDLTATTPSGKSYTAEYPLYNPENKPRMLTDEELWEMYGGPQKMSFANDAVNKVGEKTKNLPEAKYGPVEQTKDINDSLTRFQNQVKRELYYELNKDNDSPIKTGKYANNTELLNDYFWNKKYDTSDIKAVQKILNTNKNINLSVDGDIGIMTTSAIVKYAEENGLSIEQASDRLVKFGRLYDSIISTGLSENKIKEIQIQLNKLGITDIDGNILVEDSYLGENTISAIDKYASETKKPIKEIAKTLSTNYSPTVSKNLHLDEQEFGKNSDAYKILVDISNRQNTTKSEEEKAEFAAVAFEIRKLARYNTPILYAQDKITDELHKNAEIALEYQSKLMFSISNAQNPIANDYISNSTAFLIGMAYGEWDYKNIPDWQVPYDEFNGNNMYIDNNKNWRSWMYFDGMLVSGDKFGNINLGYIGTKMGLPTYVFQNFATQDKDDAFWVQYGIDLAKQGR